MGKEMNILQSARSAWRQTLRGDIQVAPGTCWSLLVVRTDLLPPSCSISHFVLVISLPRDHSPLTLVGQPGNIDKTIICSPFIWFSISITDWRRQKEKDCAIDFFLPSSPCPLSLSFFLMVFFKWHDMNAWAVLYMYVVFSICTFVVLCYISSIQAVYIILEILHTPTHSLIYIRKQESPSEWERSITTHTKRETGMRVIPFISSTAELL